MLVLSGVRGIRQIAHRRVLSLSVAASLALAPAATLSVLTAGPASALSCSGQGLAAISQDHVMARASVWLTRNVPYSQASCYGDPEYPGKSYREDCSGFVSMAWGLSTSLVVSQFPRYATRLSSWQQLQPGDALISPDGTTHMVLFAGWANAQHTAFTVWHESRPGRGTVADASGSWLNGYVAYRYNNITSTPGTEPVVNGGGTHMIGSGAYMDVSSAGQVYAWNSRYLGGSPAGYSGRFTDAKVTAGDNGYWLLTSAGQIYAYGNAPYLGGGAAGHTGDMIALAATPDGQGYAMLSSTGQVYAYGDATYYGGSPAGFSKAIVAMSPTPSGHGYVMVSAAGQVYAYGDAQYKGGSPAGINGDIADISYTPGAGYLLISTSGQHYAYGDAPFLGNPSGASLPF